MILIVVVVLAGMSLMAVYGLMKYLPLLSGLICSAVVIAFAALPFFAVAPAVRSVGEPTDFASGTYSTSTTCRNCHADHYSSWHDTFHRTMTQEASADAIVGRFDGEEITVDGYVCRPFQRDGHSYMTVVHPVWEQQELSAGHNPREAPETPTITYSVDRVVGSHHQQVYLSKGSDGAYHTLPLVWLIRQQRWITRGASFLCAPNESFYHKTKIWNNGCVFCHNTRGRPGLYEHEMITGTSYTWSTEVEELGIACEACHGSGSRHVLLNQNPTRRYLLREKQLDDPSIVNPLKLSQEQSVLTCARCHGKMIAKAEYDRTCLEEGDFFQPGDWTFPDYYDLPSHSPDEAFDESAEGQYFWPDGTPRTTALEYQGTLLSPCYQRGDMTCLSCHSMHDSDPNDQLLYGDDSALPLAQQNQACTQCHAEFADPQELTAHSHHAKTSSGSLCYNCHMPHQAYSLLKKVRSHRISVPDVAVSVTTGLPNACNSCHVDRSFAWTNDIMSQWYGSTPAELNERQSSASGAVIHALSGHALQRAIAVEQLGWPDTFDVAGVDWRARLLVASLDDPYAAVRLLAFEALQKLPGFDDLEFDFLGSPDVRSRQRQAALNRVLEFATEQSDQRLRRILGGTDASDLETLIEDFKRSRNQAEIDIRE